MTEPALEALLAATPEPPEGDDPALLEDAAAAMIAARGALLAELPAIRASLPPEDRAVLEQIAEREQRWSAVLSRARHELGVRLGALARARRARR